jgi:ATP-dependent Lhr-like helicase
VRKVARTGERVIVNATDPLNLVGVVVPGEAVPAVRTNRVVFVDGVPETPGGSTVEDSPPELDAVGPAVPGGGP